MKAISPVAAGAVEAVAAKQALQHPPAAAKRRAFPLGCMYRRLVEERSCSVAHAHKRRLPTQGLLFARLLPCAVKFATLSTGAVLLTSCRRQRCQTSARAAKAVVVLPCAQHGQPAARATVAQRHRHHLAAAHLRPPDQMRAARQHRCHHARIRPTLRQHRRRQHHLVPNLYCRHAAPMWDMCRRVRRSRCWGSRQQRGPTKLCGKQKRHSRHQPRLSARPRPPKRRRFGSLRWRSATSSVRWRAHPVATAVPAAAAAASAILAVAHQMPGKTSASSTQPARGSLQRRRRRRQTLSLPALGMSVSQSRLTPHRQLQPHTCHRMRRMPPTGRK